ncbi:D-tyrosyl-tRNA deacylase [Moesziomyces antarcticus]|uniref:D-aminoacyl-tRNA deacylase n=2 Tax=Pseudozyma antarctica TaxID=84753 RepID=A0A081CBK4_PSEA2|nr:D-tyrosyl-tRNA deacylase [Moesziomyces antarcticus]GAK64050.1 D-tyrosyl-tRNA deacylase [Moesziomyces antarcticus]
MRGWTCMSPYRANPCSGTPSLLLATGSPLRLDQKRAKMRAVLQRVKGATVHVDGKLVSKIGPGIVALIGISTEDTAAEIVPLANKILSTKLWNENQEASQITVPPQYEPKASGSTSANESTETAAAATNGETEEAKARSEQVWGGKPWKRSVVELGGEVLCVSQFTLFARTVKGTKPDFHRAMGGNDARVIYEALLKKLGDSYAHDRIKDGAFGEMMDVSLTNDGPVTILLDTTEKK